MNMKTVIRYGRCITLYILIFVCISFISLPLLNHYPLWLNKFDDNIMYYSTPVMVIGMPCIWISNTVGSFDPNVIWHGLIIDIIVLVAYGEMMRLCFRKVKNIKSIMMYSTGLYGALLFASGFSKSYVRNGFNSEKFYPVGIFHECGHTGNRGVLLYDGYSILIEGTVVILITSALLMANGRIEKYRAYRRDRKLYISAQQVDSAEASTIGVRPSEPSGSPR